MANRSVRCAKCQWVIHTVQLTLTPYTHTHNKHIQCTHALVVVVCLFFIFLSFLMHLLNASMHAHMCCSISHNINIALAFMHAYIVFRELLIMFISIHHMHVLYICICLCGLYINTAFAVSKAKTIYIAFAAAATHTDTHIRNKMHQSIRHNI